MVRATRCRRRSLINLLLFFNSHSAHEQFSLGALMVFRGGSVGHLLYINKANYLFKRGESQLPRLCPASFFTLQLCSLCPLEGLPDSLTPPPGGWGGGLTNTPLQSPPDTPSVPPLPWWDWHAVGAQLATSET